MSVDRWRDLAEDMTGGGPDMSAASAARTAYEQNRKDYLADPGRAELEILQQRALALPEDDPARIAWQAADGELSADGVMAVASLTHGLPGTSQIVQNIRTADQEVQVQKAEQKAAAQARADANKDDMWDWGPLGLLKATVRTGFSVAEAPYQIIMNTWRAYGGEMTDQDNPNDSWLDKVYAIGAGTDLGATVNEGMQRGWGNIDTGDGWFGVDPESRAGMTKEYLEGELWTLGNGEIATLGRAAASTVGLDKGSTAYSVMSGLVDAGSRIADPGMYLGAGEVKGAGLALRGYLRAGAEGAQAARDIRSGAAVGKGVSDARKLLDETTDMSAETRARLDTYESLKGNADSIRKQAEAAAEDTAKAQARHAKMSVANSKIGRQRESRVKKAAKERQKARDIETKAREAHQKRIDELVAERKTLTSVHKQIQRQVGGSTRTGRSTAEAFDWVKTAMGPSKEAGLKAATGSGDLVSRAAKIAEARLAKNKELLAAARKDLRDFNKAADGSGEIPAELLGAKFAERYAKATTKEQEHLLAASEMAAQLADAADAARQARNLANTLDAQVSELDSLAQAALDDLRLAAGNMSGDLADGTADTIRAYLDANSGIIRHLDGEKRVTIDAALQSLFKGKLDGVLRSFAKINDEVLIADLTRGRIADPAILRALARAENEDEVRLVLASYLARGDIAAAGGKYSALRLHQRFAGKDLPTTKANKAAAEAFNIPQRFIRWSVGATERRMPHTYDIHIEDGAQMVRATMDYVSYATRKWKDKAAAEALYNKHVKAMIDATTGVERKAAAYKLLDDLNAHVLRSHNIDPKSDLGKELREQFTASRSAANDLLAYNVEARSLADEAGELTLADGTKITREQSDSLVTLSAQLNERFFFPDARVIARLGKSSDAVLKAGGKREAIVDLYRTVFDDMWRTAVLLRVSYMIRNAAEVQTRMALSGHPSMWTNPFAIAAHWAGDNRLGKFLNSFKTGGDDVLGRSWADAAEADRELNRMIGEWSRMMDDGGAALLDVGLPSGAGRMERAGFVVVQQGQKGFWNGVANTASIMNRSPLTRAALTITRGKNVAKEIEEARAALGPAATLEDAVVWLATKGPEGNRYRRAYEGLIAADKRGEGDFAKSISTPEGLRDMLFGTSDMSYKTRWDNLIHGNSTVEEYVLRDLPTERATAVKAGEQTAAEETRVNKAFADVLETQFKDADGYPILESANPLIVTVKDRNRGFGLLRNWTDKFFEKAGSFERHSSVQPEQRFAYWDSIADMISGASPEAAREMVKNARASLGGKRGMTSAWGAKTLKKIEAGAAKADGAMTVEEINRFGVSMAAKHTEDLVYTAMKQNQFAHALRLVIPFAQAWANSLKVYSRLVSKNTQMVYRAGVAYNWARSEESNTVYELGSKIPMDPFGMSLYDANQGLFFEDEQGTVMAINPLGGIINNAMRFANGGQAPNMRWDMSLESGNMLFQNGVGPGFSPIVQAGVDTVTGWEAYNNLPAPLRLFDLPPIKDQLEPFRDAAASDGALNDFLASMVPGPVKGTLSLVGVGFEQEASKYVNSASAILMDQYPDKYTNGAGVITEQGARQLDEDAKRMAGALSFARSWVRFVSPTSMSPETFTHDKSGAAFSITLWGDIWTQELNDAEYDVSMASSSFIRKYGTAPLLNIVKTVDGASGFPGAGAWDWIQRHGDVLDPAVAGYLFPSDEYSFEYARQIREGGTTRKMTVEERAKAADALLYSAASGNLSKLYAAGQLSDVEYNTARTNLTVEFGGMASQEMDRNARSNTIEKLRNSLTLDGVNESPVAEAIAYYFEARDQAIDIANSQGLSGNLSNKAMAPYAEWLNAKLDYIESQVPEFKVVSQRLFRKELSQ